MSAELDAASTLAGLLQAAGDARAANGAIEELIDRIVSSVSLVVPEFGQSCDAILAAITQARIAFRSSARALVSTRLKRIDIYADECKGVEAAYQDAARALARANAARPTCSLSDLLCMPLPSPSYFPCTSHYVSTVSESAQRVAESLSSSARHSASGISCISARCRCPAFSKFSAARSVTVVFEDTVGEPVRGIRCTDIRIVASSEALSIGPLAQTAVSSFAFDVGCVRALPVGVESISVTVSLFGAAVGYVSVPMGHRVQGRFLRKYCLPARIDEFTCMALSADDRTLVCGSELTRRLYVYDIHDKVVVRSIGGGGMGRGQFDRPQKVRFLPRGTLLVAESLNQRLQEVTAAGDFVRFVGVDVITGPVTALDVTAGPDGSKDTIAAGISGMGRQVFLFDLCTGACVGTFGAPGAAPGSLSGCSGIRFSPDGSELTVAEARNNRASLFSTQGVLSRCVCDDEGMISPADVELAGNGDLLLLDRGRARVLVISGGTVRSFGGRGTKPGEMSDHVALCAGSNRLFVLERGGHIHEFK